MKRSKNYQGRQGLGCKTTLSSTSRTRIGANRGGGGPGVHGRRRSGHRGAELGHKTDRGGEDELDGGLTSGGRRRRRPEFEVIATGGTGRLGLAAASGSARAATQQGEER
jgi:hypothetical protein